MGAEAATEITPEGLTCAQGSASSCSSPALNSRPSSVRIRTPEKRPFAYRALTIRRATGIVTASRSSRQQPRRENESGTLVNFIRVE